MDSGLGVTVADLLAESKARFATPDQAAPVAEQPKEASAAGEAAVASTPETETPEAVKPDLSWLPDEVRGDFEGVPADVLSKVEKLKGHVLRQADYTRKTQEVAAQRKDIEAAKQKAALWDQILSDKEKASAVLSILEGKPVATATAKPFDWTTATAEEIDAEVERRAAAKARTEVERAIEERFTAPVSKAQAINQSVGEYLRGVEGLTDDQRVTAFKAVIDRYGEGNLLTLDPEVVVKLVEPEARALALEAQLSALRKSTPSPQKVARAASSPGTGSVAPAGKAAQVPSLRQDASEEERLEAVAKRMSAQLGQHVTPKDIEALFS